MHDNSSGTPRSGRRVINPKRLRDSSSGRLPDLLLQKQKQAELDAEERMRRLREKFEAKAEKSAAKAENAAEPAATVPPPGRASPGPPNLHSASSQSIASEPSTPAERTPYHEKPARTAKARSKRGKVKRRKEYLEPKQHARLRDQIEHLWAVDKRFRNWSLLARAAGLSSGQAVKRAYEVNSSMATLRNIDTFARLHAGFGSKATKALKAGVPIEKLQAHLMGTPDGGDAGDSRERETERTGARTSARIHQAPAMKMDDLGETPPTVDFESMLDAGRAVDTEVKRLWLIAKFFEQMSAKGELPGPLRESAVTARRHVLSAVSQFASGDTPGHTGPEDARPAGVVPAGAERTRLQSADSVSPATS